MLFNEPKLLKFRQQPQRVVFRRVSVLFNEPKLLKSRRHLLCRPIGFGSFSALQRAEIAEIGKLTHTRTRRLTRFSALQRAEIAEMRAGRLARDRIRGGFSALQRAEIAEIGQQALDHCENRMFQCSSTSRNC